MVPIFKLLPASLVRVNAGAKLHNVLGLELTLLDIPDILDTYRATLAHKGNEMRFLTFMFVKQPKI